MQRSGFWIRTAATMLDALVFLVLFVAIALTAGELEAQGRLTESMSRALEALLLGLWLAYSSMEVMIGATAGKLVSGIVITLPDGAPAPPWTRLLRWSTKQFGALMLLIFALTDQPLFYVLAGLANLLILIGFLRVLGEEKRAWHDLWSHTAVVSRSTAARMRAVREEPVGPPTPT